MKTVDQQIEEAEGEVQKLKSLKKMDENSLLRRVTVAIRDAGFVHWTSQKFEFLKIESHIGYFGECIEVIIPIGYTLFSLVQELEMSGLYVVSIGTEKHEDTFSISITDKERADYKLIQENKYKK